MGREPDTRSYATACAKLGVKGKRAYPPPKPRPLSSGGNTPFKTSKHRTDAHLIVGLAVLAESEGEVIFGDAGR